MLRVVNERHQAFSEATVRLNVLRSTTTAEGKNIRKFLNLKLGRTSTPMIGLSWTLIHPIDEQSPLWSVHADDWVRDEILLSASITGYDESISAPVVARQAAPSVTSRTMPPVMPPKVSVGMPMRFTPRRD